MVDLAIHYGEMPVPLRDIAQRQMISEKYLWNLIGPFKTAALIRSEHGSHDGFAFARPLSGITMKDIGKIRKFLPQVDKETYCANTLVL